MQSEGYLKSMEFTARYASALAQDRQHKTPTLQDVEESIKRMMPEKKIARKKPPAGREGSGRLKEPLTPSSAAVNGREGESGSQTFKSNRTGVSPGQDRKTPLLVECDLAPA